MRARRLAAALSGLALLGGCVFPTERDASVHVSVTPIRILFRGTDTVATARAWQMIGPADSQPIPNVVFVWSSNDPSVASVDGTGRLVGINPGTAIVTVAAANFDRKARPAADTVRVATPLEIDSVRPDTVRYGEIVSVYGVSVDSIVSATLSGAALIRVPFGDTVYPGGTARSRWWVPPPAHTDSLFFLGITGGNGVLGYAHGDTTTVIEQDLYEPDDTVPRVLDLDAPPPFPAYPALLVSNPALAFEPIKRPAVTGADWYRLAQAETRDLTIILTAPQIAGTFQTYLTDSLVWNSAKQSFGIGPDSWTFGPRLHACHGLPFTPSEALGDSTIVAFKGLPAGTLDAVAVYAAAGRYGLAVIAGYQSELPADAHEDDNSCNAADLRDTLSLPFRDTLAIENPHDVDWLRFTVPGGSYQFRLHAFPGTGAASDSLKDLDLYVIKVPNPGDASLQVVSADTAAGSDVDRTLLLAAGDYYAVVVDFAGATTSYEICAAVPVTGACASGFPAPPAPSAPRQAAATPPATLDLPLFGGGP
jgi:Bacterial Ig-like domain (group 2)